MNVVEGKFVDHFKDILAPANISPRTAHQFQELQNLNITGKLTENEAIFLSRTITGEEIEAAIRYANLLKSPVPDGFNVHFYKCCWPIRGNDVTEAIIDFFYRGQTVNQVKNAFIALILKFDNPSAPGDFRPISLTNELYKIIARIIAARLKSVINEL